MPIDIDRLNEAELIELNHRIVSRLKFLRDMRAHASMLSFSIGEKVSFQPPDRGPLFGTITRYNRKSVTVITDAGEHWTVGPTLLRKLKPVAEAAPAGGTGQAAPGLPRPAD
jgi:hypothetical protein